MNNTELKEEVNAIKVAEEDRLNTLPNVFGHLFMMAEGAIYSFMDGLSPDYSGGYWEFMVLSNGGFFMYPAHDGDMKVVVNGNYFEDTLSPESAGIIACLFTFSHLSFKDSSGRFADLYHLLLEYAAGLEDSVKIFRAID